MQSSTGHLQPNIGDADDVVAALEEQLGHYRRLAKLSELQHELVQQSRMDELVELLQRKNEVVGEVTRLERVVGSAKKRWGDYLAGLADPAIRDRAESLEAEASRLYAAVTAADQRDALVLRQRSLGVGQALRQTHAATKVNRGYAASAYAGAGGGRMNVKS